MIFKDNAFKMIIRFDENKIEQDGVYKIEWIYNALNKLFSKINIQIVKNGIYASENYGLIIAPIAALEKENWFLDYVTEWRLISPNGDEDNLLQ